jgi:tetratricopeptide (TPR) repeat protein
LISRFELDLGQLCRLAVVAMVGLLCVLASPRAGSAQAPAAPPAALAPPGPVDTLKARQAQSAADFKAGRAAFDAKQLAEASAYFQRASQYDPDNQDAVYWLGRTFLEQYQNQSAVDHFNALIAMNPRSDRAYYARAKGEVHLGQYPAAIADFNKYLEINKGEQNEIYYTARGDAYLDNGENDLALRDYDRALQINSSLPVAYLHRGIAYARLMNYTMAMADFATADKLGRATNTLESGNFFYRGIVEYLSGDKPSAATDFKSTQVYNDARKDTARCLGAIATGGLFSRMGCSGIDAVKELNKPAVY